MLNFNGQSDDDLGLVITDVKPLAAPGVSLSQQSVPGGSGSQLMGRTLTPRAWGFTGYVKGTTFADASEKAAAIGAWLGAVPSGQMILDDLPDRYWTAGLSGDIAVDVAVLKRTVSFTMVASDPIARSLTDTDETTLTAGATSGVVNPGNAPSAPLLTATLGSACAHVTLVKDANEFVTLGIPKEASATVTQDTGLFWEDCDDISDWSTGAAHDAVTTASGTMAVVDGAFEATDFGSGTNWHGPIKRRSFASTRDLRVEVDFRFYNGATTWRNFLNEVVTMSGTSDHQLAQSGRGVVTAVRSSTDKVRYVSGRDYTWHTDGVHTWIARKSGGKMTNSTACHVDYKADVGALNYDRGKAVLYLLDGNYAELAKVAISDTTDNRANGQVLISAGNTWMCQSFGYKVGTRDIRFNDVDLRLVMERRTSGGVTRWRTYVSIWANGRWSACPQTIANHKADTTATPVNFGAVDLGLFKYGSDTACDMSVKRVRVIALGDNGASNSYVSFASGDVLTADLATGRITLNGEERPELLSLDSRLFALEPGTTPLGLKCDSGATVAASVSLTPRFW